MKIPKLLLLSTLSATLATSTPAQLLSGPILNPANGHTYFIGDSRDWLGAESLALSLGGHLTTVNDAAENTWIANTFGMWGGAPRQLWLGLSDSITEGQYYWLSGESSSYRNWAPGEPNNGAGYFPDEDGVTMWNPASGFPYSTWTDSPIDQMHYPIIEVVPEPTLATLATAGLVVLFIRRRQPSLSVN